MPDYPLWGLEGWHIWLILGLVLGIAELLAPGAYLMFLGAAAFITGLIVGLLGISGGIEFAIFGILAVVSAYIGWIIYRRSPGISSDPMLNDRGARLVGQIVRVVEPVTSTGGRAKVGDGEWPARGPDMPVGTTARIVSVENGMLYLETVEAD